MVSAAMNKANIHTGPSMAYKNARIRIKELEQQLDECIGAIENIFGGGGPEIVPDWIMDEIERRENW